MNSFLIGCFFSILVAFLVWILAYQWLSMPLVTLQYPSGDCVKVDSPENEFSCESMPERFTIQWVIK